MNEKQSNIVYEELKKARETWRDLPSYVYSSQYYIALLEWIRKCVEHGITNIKTLVLWALHHETEGREPYFEFNRKGKYVISQSWTKISGLD